MWKLWLTISLLLKTLASGQDQFHRAVNHPSGPSQVVLSGGGFGNGNGEDFGTQPLSAAEQDRYADQGIPFQSNGEEHPIPQNGGENNPFTNGDDGFGLRLTDGQQPPSTGQRVQQTPVIAQQPNAIQEQEKPRPVVYHLPKLPEGQQYVDVYGRPIILTQPTIQTTQPPPPPPPTAPPVPVQTQAFVDRYGRTLAEFQTVQQGVPVVHTAHAPVLHQVVHQPAGFPVVENVIQPVGVPVVEHVLQPAGVPVVKKLIQQEEVVLAKKVAPVTLQTYAVPAIQKVGNLAIPFAKKVIFAQQAGLDVVLPPSVPALAAVKSVHKTVFSPVNLSVPVPVVNEAPAAVPVVQEAALPVHHEVPVHPNHVGPGQVLLHAPQQVFYHHPQQFAQVQEHQQFLVPQPQQFVHVQGHQQVLVQQPPQQLVQVDGHHQVVLPQPQQLIQVQGHQQVVLPQPQQLVQVPGHPPHLVHVQEQHHVAVPHAVHVEQPVAHAVGHHPVHLVHHAPHVVVPAAPVIKKVLPAVTKVIEKTIVPEVTVIHQPVLSKPLFQKHIFNVRHGSNPLIYQDLCTVYPYQKNLRACVLRKAILPELHHPDVRTVNVEDQRQQPLPDQSIIIGGAPIFHPAPPKMDGRPTVSVMAMLPNNIQEQIRRESARSRQQAMAVTARTTTATTTTTTVQPVAAESRESKKRRSGNSRRRKAKDSTSTTTEKAFKLV